MSDTSVKLKAILDVGNPDAQMMRLQKRIVATADKLDKVKKKMEEVGNAKVPTDDYKYLTNELKKAEKEIEKFTAKAYDMQKLGTDSGKAWERLQYHLENARKNAQGLKEEMSNMRASGEAFTSGKDTQQYGDLSAQRASLEKELEIAAKSGAERMSKAISNAKNPIKAVFKSIADIAKKTFKAVGEVAKKAFQVMQKMASVAKNAFASLGKQVLKSFSGFTKAHKQVDGLSKRIWGLAKRVFVFSLITKALRAMRTAISEGLQDYAKYSSAYNATMSEFSSASATAKNALASFAAPIMQAVIPALTTLINWVTSAANALNNLMAVISGRGTWSKAVKQQKDYAASLAGTAGASEKAKQSLAGFDDLDVLQSNDDAGGGGGGGAAADAGALWEEQEAVKPDWFNPDDWSTLGVKLAEGIESALKDIPWDKIQSTAATIGTRLSELVNGVISVPSMWQQLGSTLAQGLNTGLIFLHNFLGQINWLGLGQDIGLLINQAVYEFDWVLLGQTIADAINMKIQTIAGLVATLDWAALGTSVGQSISTALTNIDWVSLGQGFNDLALGLLSAIKEAIRNVDWLKIGTQIKEGFKKVDWVGIVEGLAEAFGLALGGLALLLYGALGDAVQAIEDYFAEKIEECGGNVVLGLLKGIWDGICGIAQWLYEHVVKPFVDAFKEMFGIHSPSKVMDEIGGFLIDGLFGGIKRIWETLMSWLGDALDGIKEAFSTAWDVIQSVAETVWGVIKDVIIDPITTVWDKIKEILDKIKKKWEDVWGGIRDFIKGIINGIIGAINGMLRGMASGINGIVGAVNKLSFDIPDWVPFAGGKHFGFNLQEVTAPQIPLLANGGITTGSTLAMIGEAGKEAVLPLENNTGWMSDLAGMINNNTGNNRPINLQIDGRTFAKLVLPYLDNEQNIVGTKLVTG